MAKPRGPIVDDADVEKIAAMFDGPSKLSRAELVRLAGKAAEVYAASQTAAYRRELVRRVKRRMELRSPRD